MMTPPAKPMRDMLISRVRERMAGNSDIVFLSADMGAPALDAIREEHADRFFNVGIAEQNMINIAAGLAMEGVEVYTYAIAPFYLRAYEQIRINLALPAQLRPMNVCMLALGGGMSYDVSGPTHHCLEDICVMRAMANIVTVSPSDWTMAEAIADMTAAVDRPKYVRLDGKNIAQLYPSASDIDFRKGFTHLKQGKGCCVVATGQMVHAALRVAQAMGDEVGVIDLFMLDTCDQNDLAAALSGYRGVVTIEEGFIERGGLDSLVSLVVSRLPGSIGVRRLGMPNVFTFVPATRSQLHELYGFGDPQLRQAIIESMAGSPAPATR